MVIIDINGKVIWMTSTTSNGADRVELLDTRYLVLKDMHGKILQQSFDFLTNTFLPDQLFTKTTNLISGIGNGTYRYWYFTLYFDNDNDNDNVLRFQVCIGLILTSMCFKLEEQSI